MFSKPLSNSNEKQVKGHNRLFSQGVNSRVGAITEFENFLMVLHVGIKEKFNLAFSIYPSPYATKFIIHQEVVFARDVTNESMCAAVTNSLLLLLGEVDSVEF